MASISSNSSPDLYLWQTEIYGDSVHHNVLKTDGDLTPAIWRQVKQIGAGGYGVVWLQERQPEKELRAVKKISKRSLNTQGADFMRELRTLIDVSDVSRPKYRRPYMPGVTNVGPIVWRSFRPVLWLVSRPRFHLHRHGIRWARRFGSVCQGI